MRVIDISAPLSSEMLKYPSLKPFAHRLERDYSKGDKDKPAHKILLRAGMLLLEGICLAGVSPGVYQLICFPLSIKGSEAAPCRAVLIDEGENV